MRRRFAWALQTTARYLKNPRLFRLRARGVLPGLFERLDCPWFHSLNLETVLDIGAYVGRYTETFHALWPHVKIYSFEPLVDCFQELEQRANRIPQLTALNYGLSDEAGEQTLQRHEFAPSSSLLKMTSIHKGAFPDTAESQPVTIRMERLDEVAENFQLTLPMLVKIDVQGFEDQVLSGGENTIKKASAIIIETSFVPLYDGQPLFRDIHRQLTGWGFLYAGSVAQLRSDTSGEILQEDSLFLRR
ncbi:uncharacterized protein METZ01_LOCUS198152 [marine metagenome]|uniref:Methyltransferase FkbM domain-containing protein n=1 Tax=marine metagenome TaxID=408172 RepID=A0A382E3S2_9ZZZZ